MRVAQRLDQIEPFYVMECAKAAERMASGPLCDPAQGGRPMIYLNIGEPDFTAAPAVAAAAQRCIAQGQTQYTSATGLPALRRAISGWYQQRFHLDIDPERIIVTAGASAALQLATLALVDVGDEWLLPDPSYPCNRHFVAACGGQPRLVPTTAAQRFQLSERQVIDHWGLNTRGVLLASPSNPTGTSIAPQALAGIVSAVRERGGATVVDEIYLGLGYDERFAQSALSLGDDVITVNSFSKYFSMTGWRLGWLVVPRDLVGAIERLAQNLYICASTVAQHAALACFEPESLAVFEQRRQAFQQRRDWLVPALEAVGFKVPVSPDGAFYVWADCTPFGKDSWTQCLDLMQSTQVALTPGRDFGPATAAQFLRVSFATNQQLLQEAVARLHRELHTSTSH